MEGRAKSLEISEDDLVFVTDGGCIENSTMGDQNTPDPHDTQIRPGGGWDMWRK